MHEELGACAETLRRELGHPVRSLCWPWGSGSEVAREEGRKAGFSVFFTTRMGANPPARPRPCTTSKYATRVELAQAQAGNLFEAVAGPPVRACRI
ncbi:MAG: hypothetical protein ACLSTO_05945 [Bilophila wadsworthia]